MVARIPKPPVDVAYTLMRCVAGIMFGFHGFQKIFGVLTEFQPAVGTQLWIGGVIELVTGAAVALGLFTSWAAFLASGTMAVAYIQFHWKLELGARMIPAVNEGELALLYCVLFFYIAGRGAGKWSLATSRSGSIGGAGAHTASAR